MDKRNTLIIVSAITAVILIGGLYLWQKNSEVPVNQISDQQEDVAPQQSTMTEQNNPSDNESVDGITYHNDIYKFSLTFPETWKGFIVKNRTIDWDTLGTSNSIDIGFLAQDSLFNISMHTKDQWQKILSQEGPKPNYLGENSLYVFAYERAQYAADDAMIERMKEIPTIISTLTLDNK